jgi:hypothetical protein
MKTETELKELDAWIAEHVMGWELWIAAPDCPVYRTGDKDNPTQKWFKPTTKSSSAMMVLEKCCERLPLHVEIGKYGENWCVSRPDQDATEAVIAPTLPLAICLFAKALFSNGK